MPYYDGESYTAGQGVISLRFDDWVSGDVSYFVPELDTRGLVAGFAIPSARMGTGG